MPKKKNARASNGMGSIRQRADGRWEARYSTPEGRQKSVYGKSEKEVTAKLRGALHDLDSGAWREPSKITVGEWLDIWLADYQEQNTDRTTKKYKCIVNNHIRPLLGSLKMSKVTSMHARRLMNELIRAGLSTVTVHGYMGIFKAIMQSAVEAKVIQESPMTGIKPPKPTPKKFLIVDRADIPAFIEAAKETKYPNEIIFMLYTGLRVGEIRGLRWSDVDFNAGTINVQQQIHPRDVSPKQVTPPKYGEDRVIHLPHEALDVLKDQRKRQAEARLASGDWEDTDVSRDLVFRRKNGQPHNDKSIYFAVKKAGETIGMPDLHPHDLRHSYAVAALRSGADVKTVQHNLGHRSSKMTLDVYAAYTEDAGRESAEKLSAYLKTTEKKS